jgi:type IV secretion system protein VirB2
MKLSLVHVFDHRALRAAQAAMLTWLLFRPAAASGQSTGASGSGGMPWETPLQNLVASLTGPVAKAIGIAAIVCLGIGIAFSEGGSMLRKALFVVFGLALTFSAATWALPFLGFSGQ